MSDIKRQAGTVDPSEYDWEKEFSQLDTLNPYTKLDTGKVLGLAIALQDAQKEVEEWKKKALRRRQSLNKQLERDKLLVAQSDQQQQEIDRLTAALEEIREIYAGMDGFTVETAPEGYCMKIIKDMYRVFVQALKTTPPTGDMRMSEIKRYGLELTKPGIEPATRLVECANGGLVNYSAYESLQKEVEELKAQSEMDEDVIKDAGRRLKGQQQEIDRLTAILDKAIGIFLEHREEFGLCEVADKSTGQTNEELFEDKFAELIVKDNHGKHDYVPDMCGKPEHDICIVCGFIREEIEALKTTQEKNDEPE